MPMTRCPSCQAQLEVPSVVPGGLVACPYCGHEFPVRQDAPVSRGPGRGAPRRGGRYDDGYDEGPARGYYRKRSDLAPIIGVVIAVLILVGGGLFLLLNSKAKEQEKKDRVRGGAVSVPTAKIYYVPSVMMPDGRSIDSGCLFQTGDLVTVTRYNRSEGVTFVEQGKPPVSMHAFSAQYKTLERGEKIISVDGSQPTHEGVYYLGAFLAGSPPQSYVQGEVPIGATFKTDGTGRPVPGSFQQTSGPNFPVTPDFICDRSFGAVPTRTVQGGERFGLENLFNPLANHITIDGRPMASLLDRGVRQGGWWVSSDSTLERREDLSWTHRAMLELKLLAVQNHPAGGDWMAVQFRGQPAEISCGIKWAGGAVIGLKKLVLKEIKDMTCTVHVRIRTAETYYDWKGSYSISYQMYKDP